MTERGRNFILFCRLFIGDPSPVSQIHLAFRCYIRNTNKVYSFSLFQFLKLLRQEFFDLRYLVDGFSPIGSLRFTAEGCGAHVSYSLFPIHVIGNQGRNSSVYGTTIVGYECSPHCHNLLPVDKEKGEWHAQRFFWFLVYICRR